MKKKTIYKSIALANFVLLLAAFLLFRNGSFDKFLYDNSDLKLTSPNGGTPVKTAKDSAVKKTDSIRRQRLSSSKSLVIIDNIKLKTDTIKPKPDSPKINVPGKEKPLMYSSKSGIIVDPKMVQKITIPDTIKFNGKKPKKQNQQ
jgi:hypothetical protein